MATRIREMKIEDYEKAFALWQRSEGLGLSEADTRANVERFLARNPSLCLVAEDGGELVGTALCGHDGRRGYLHHLAVAPDHRRQGLGRALAEKCLAGLKAQGITKCHLFVLGNNAPAIDFWKRLGFASRPDINLMSRAI